MKKKKIVLFVFLIVGVLSLILTYKFKQNNLNKNKPVKEEKLSIMIKEDGATDYTKSSSKDIPKGDYTLNYEKSYCKNNGKIEGYDNTTGTVSFAFIGTDSCFLYFDYKIPPLYNVIENRYNNSDTYVKLYNGTKYGDTTAYANNIYYFTDNVENNNVLFANFCWKIVRTTDTGGVKIVYNGTLKDGSCNNTGENSQIGTNSFNFSNYDSPAYVGYMYNENKVYTYSVKTIINSVDFSGQKAYGDGATYASYKYTLTNAATLTVSSSNISSLVGKYTCNSSSTTETCYNLWYIAGYSGTKIYYYSLSRGTTDVTTLVNQDYVFGSSFTYTNGTYTLSDTVTLNSDTFIDDKSNVNTHHYTCLTNGNSCTSIYYFYFIPDSTSDAYYITLTGGKSVSDALNEMLYADDVNTKDSTIKAYIDSWYENNLASYEDKLEDTVFCNDRSIAGLGGWNPNGGNTNNFLYFKNGDTSNKSLACANETDRFSVNNTKARLKYPIGLLTAPELRLANYGSSHYFNSGQWVLIGSPYYSYGSTYFVAVGSSGLGVSDVSASLGVRPSISLKPNTIPSSGDGSYTKPFVIN